MLNKKDTIRNKRLLDTYGITLEEYKEKYKSQGGKCWICLRKYKILNVDHRHVLKYKLLSEQDKKKEVRGLCCMRCNKFTIGSLEIHKNAREILNKVNEYFNIYKLKGD